MPNDAKPTDRGCLLPPVGWCCSRTPGHDGPCAARPISPLESSELRAALDEIVFSTEQMIRLEERNGGDDPYREQEERQTEARSRIEELFARQEADRLVEMTDPKTGNKCPVSAKALVEVLSAEISRLRSERTEIAQEFGVSTDFDLGEHARVVMASLDDFKAELSRLRAIGEVR